MHDDVSRPKGSYVAVVTLKSKMAASSANTGGNRKSTLVFDLSESLNKSPKPLLDGQPHQNTCQHFCHLNFPLAQCTF